MKKMKLSILAVLSAVPLLIASCTATIMEPELPSDTSSVTSKMKLRLSRNSSTRSSISPDDDLIKSICVIAYNQEDRRLADMQVAESADEIELELTAGLYNIYVIANMDTFVPPADERLMSEASYIVHSLSEHDSVLPMCWQGQAEIRGGSNTVVYATLSRLVSKIGFKVDMGVLEGLKIISARVCQGAGTIRPFMPGGSRIMSSTEAVDGDYATPKDIQTLGEGAPIYFYVTENCQGILLPDNNDPWQKVPDNIGNVSNLCTYVEMEGVWEDGADYEGSVIYRFYLGEDAEKSFDIRRNSIHNLTLYLEDDSFDKISWKIDASNMEAVNWDVHTNLQNNFHEASDFYVTENICVEFTLDEKAQRYWSKRDDAFALTGIDYSGNTIIKFKAPTRIKKGTYQAIGTCIGAGDFDLLMLNSRNGAIEYHMASGTVKVPNVVAGNGNEYADKVVDALIKESELKINGNSCDIFLYLTDKDGYNLNQGHFWGCDFSVCDWHMEILNNTYGHELFRNANFETKTGDCGNDGFAICYKIGIANEGDDESWNRTLTESLGKGILKMAFTEQTSGARGNHSMALYYDKLEITFKPVPDDKKSALGTEFMYVVDNPSNLPIRIRGLKLNSMNRIPSLSELRPILCPPITNHTSSIPLHISPMPYTVCSLEGNATKSIIINGKGCYAANDGGINQSDIPDQRSMFHTFEVEYMYGSGLWMPTISGKMDLYDTQAHSTLYGKTGYTNCGIILHSDKGGRQNIFDQNNGLNTDFRQYGEIMEKSYIPKFHNATEVHLSINSNNEIAVTSSRNISLDISVEGSLGGHIRCVSQRDPFNVIWGHYFTESKDFSVSKSITAGTKPLVIDGGALADSFESLRASKYYSILDINSIDEFRYDPGTKTGTIREYLKPEYLYLTFDITSSDGTPVVVSFSGTADYDYKTSNPVTWITGLFSSVTMVPSTYPGFDSDLDDYGCPPGETFKEEFVQLTPIVSFSNSHRLYTK